MIGAALKNFKKLIKVPRTQQSKKQKVRTNHSHAPPPNRRFLISTHQAEIDPQVNITRHSCCSPQLWRRSGTLAWVVPATTLPKSTPKVSFTHKNRPAQPFPPPKKIEDFSHPRACAETRRNSPFPSWEQRALRPGHLIRHN